MECLGLAQERVDDEQQDDDAHRPGEEGEEAAAGGLERPAEVLIQQRP